MAARTYGYVVAFVEEAINALWDRLGYERVDWNSHSTFVHIHPLKADRWRDVSVSFTSRSVGSEDLVWILSTVYCVEGETDIGVFSIARGEDPPLRTFYRVERVADGFLIEEVPSFHTACS